MRSSSALLLPDPPRWFAGRPEVVQLDHVLVGVHALPEALVPVGGELPVVRQALERLPLEDAVGGEVVERPGLHAEEAAVDPVVEPRLLAEAGDPAVLVDDRDAPLAEGPD